MTARAVSATPRVLLISQWPSIRNAEYELIEKIKKTGYPIKVVDFFGYEVESKQCLNTATLADDFDFAISFHYDTPKFLNLRTYLWVANPLEFMHYQSIYRTVLINQLRSYDDYLYNGSIVLKEHIRRVVGSEWRDSGLSFIGSCARDSMLPPRRDATRERGDKVFYCGINWERGSGRSGRAQGLLDLLQSRDLAEFYGPRVLEGINPWEGFTSYRGEIPFDGHSMFETMQQYGAVLAVSSPAHLKSRTASGRVFEGLAAGIPVISDENPLVVEQFGDLVYYFRGATEDERADSIQAALDRIVADPEEAFRKVSEAQALIAREYSFETCLERILASIPPGRAPEENEAPRAQMPDRRIDVHLVDHDPFRPAGEALPTFDTLAHLDRAIREVLAHHDASVHVRLHSNRPAPSWPDALPDVSWSHEPLDPAVSARWDRMRLGEKLEHLAPIGDGDLAVFLTPFDFVEYDYFTKALDWFDQHVADNHAAVHVGGFFVDDLAKPAPASAIGVLRNNVSIGLYQWSADSIAEHVISQFCFNRLALQTLDLGKLATFDVVLPVALVLQAMTVKAQLHRSRHLLTRQAHGYFHRYHRQHAIAESKGFWSLQYDLMSNFTHEINSLYDAFHESVDAVAIADQISGHAWAKSGRAPGVDPAVYAVNNFIARLRPLYRAARRFKRLVTFAALRGR